MRYKSEVRSQKCCKAPVTSRRLAAWCLMSFYSVFCILLFATAAFPGGKGGVRTVAVITGDEIMGRLKQPSGLFFDEIKKRLYIADSGNGRLVSFDSEFKYMAELTN